MGTQDRAKYRRDLLFVLLAAFLGCFAATLLGRQPVQAPRADGCSYAASETANSESRVVTPAGQPAVVRQDVTVTLFLCESKI